MDIWANVTRYTSLTTKNGLLVLSGVLLVIYSLLAHLTPDSQKREIMALERFETSQQYNPSKATNDGVLLHGAFPPRPIYDMSGYSLPSALTQRWEKYQQSHYASTIQAYTIPAILRGRNVVGVAAAGTGRKLAYIIPLISQVLNSEKYPSTTEGGTGPIMLILSPSSQRAGQVHRMCDEMIAEKLTCRLILIHGGDKEQNYYIDLLNGCEVMVATPSCLVRMLQHKYTNFKRLSHIVMDSADVLFDQFSNEVADIMQRYSDVVERRVGEHWRQLPRQILVFSSRWTHRIRRFCSAFVLKPVVVVTSGCEAAIYGKIRHIVTLCSPASRYQSLLGLLDSIVTTEQKIIIFTVDSHEELGKLLQSYSYYVLVVSASITPRQRAQAKADWIAPHHKDSPTILVCTDDCVFDLNLSSATSIIHFDIPNSRTKFGNRLFTMRDYFEELDDDGENQRSRGENDDIRPVSFLLIGEDSGHVIIPIVEMIKRSESEMPRALERLAEKLRVEKEATNGELCDSLKAFGKCRLGDVCRMRHSCTKQLDANDTDEEHVPSFGEIKFKVLHVVTACRWYIRILDKWDKSGSRVNAAHHYTDLMCEMVSYFSVPERRQPIVSLIVGALCCYLDEDNIAHRCEVLSIEKFNPSKPREQLVQVRLVDQGSTKKCFSVRLYELPAILKKIPHQAVEVFLSRLVPVDKDSEWTPKASFFVSDLVRGKELSGKIVLKLGQSLWLDPVVERVRLRSINVCVNQTNIRSELIKRKFADPNPDHLKMLYDLVKGTLEHGILWKYTRISSLEKLPDVEGLGDQGSETNVFVSTVITPEQIYVQLEDTQSSFNKLMDKISEHIASIPRKSESPKLTSGQYCLAKCCLDDRFYRAQVLATTDRGDVTVFFVDFGDRETVASSDVVTMPPSMLQLPLQAIECSIAHVSPLDDDWSDEARDSLWNMTTYCNGYSDRRSLEAKVIGRTVAGLGNSPYCYSIELKDRNSAIFTVDMGEELAWHLLAYPDTRFIEDLFPKLDNGLDISSVRGLCCHLYWSKNLLGNDGMVEELSYLMRLAVRKMEPITPSLIRDVWHLILYRCHESLFTRLLPILADILYHEPTLLTHLLQEGFAQRLCQCIFKINDDSAVLSILASIRTLSSFVPMKMAFSEDECTESFSVKLSQDLTMAVRVSLLMTLADLCNDSDVMLLSIIGMDFLTTLTDIMRNSVEHGVVIQACRLFLYLAQSPEFCRHVEKQSVINIVAERIKRADISHIDLELLAAILEYLMEISSHGSKFNMSLLETGLYPHLKNLWESGLLRDQKCHTLCDQLMSALTVKLPTQELQHPFPVTRGRLTTKNLQDSFASSHQAEVLWTENTFYVMLTVNLRGVQKHDLEIIFHHDSVNFRAVLDGELYEFELVFYDQIIPNDCKHKITNSQVLISCKKQKPGRWQRLLKSKVKPLFLLCDYEKLDTSSSQSDSDHGHFFTKKRKKKNLLTKDIPDAVKNRAYAMSSDNTLSSSDDDFMKSILSYEQLVQSIRLQMKR